MFMLASFWLVSMMRCIDTFVCFCTFSDWLPFPAPWRIFSVDEMEAAFARCFEIFFWLLSGSVLFRRFLPSWLPYLACLAPCS